MEFTKRSNFTLDLTNIATSTVTIKKGLTASDLIGVIVKTGPGFCIINIAYDSNGIVAFNLPVGNSVTYNYNPATGQITVAS